MNAVFSHRLEVRWREMDALGHVNNAQYLSYVEETRVQWFNAVQTDWQAQPSAPIVAAVHVDFRRPIHWPESIMVHLYADRRGGRSANAARCAAGAPEEDHGRGQPGRDGRAPRLQARVRLGGQRLLDARQARLVGLSPARIDGGAVKTANF